MKNSPPMGVIGPIIPICEIFKISFVEIKYNEPEKRIIPMVKNQADKLIERLAFLEKVAKNKRAKV